MREFRPADNGADAQNEFIDIFNPLVRLVDKDLKIAILTDYAYLGRESIIGLNFMIWIYQ